MEENVKTQLKTDRSWIKTLLLGLVTFGIYQIVVITKIAKEVNLLAKDGKHTMHFCLVFFIFGGLTLGIAPLVWWHRLCNRIGDELKRRSLAYEFSAGTFWGWNVLGAFIGVGPIIFLHKLCQATNMLNADYNAKG